MAIVRKKGVADVTKRGVADVTKKGVANVRMAYVPTPYKHPKIWHILTNQRQLGEKEAAISFDSIQFIYVVTVLLNIRVFLKTTFLDYNHRFWIYGATG